MKTEEIALSRLTENEDNPRQITKENFAKLVRSLLVFPKMLEIRPVVVDEQMKVLGGNMRTRALAEIAKMDAVKMREQIDADGRFTEGEKIAIIDYWNAWKEKPSVRIVRADDLTEAQKREFIIKDNAGFGDWDMDKLANEWDDVPLTEWGVPDWLAAAENEGEERREATEDNYKADQEAPKRVKRGEIWQLGNHRLMCGDSTDAEQVKRLTAGNPIHLLVTDPPYNVNYQGSKKSKRVKIVNDNMDADSFVNFLTDAFAAADEVMVEGGVFYIWYASSQVVNFLTACANVGWGEKQNLIWYKNCFNLGFSDYQWIHEPCIYGWKEGKHYFCSDRSLSTVWQDEKPDDYNKLKKAELVELVKKLTSPAIPTTVIEENKPNKSDLHPTMKPVRLFAAHMQNSSKAGWNVLDLFGGSGTTIIAAEQMERNAFVMEYQEGYCDTIIERWEIMTGKTAVKIEDPKTE